jgi:hypothetical protein
VPLKVWLRVQRTAAEAMDRGLQRDSPLLADDLEQLRVRPILVAQPGHQGVLRFGSPALPVDDHDAARCLVQRMDR